MYVYVCMYMYVHICMCVCMYVCICMCVCMCACIHVSGGIVRGKCSTQNGKGELSWGVNCPGGNCPGRIVLHSCLVYQNRVDKESKAFRYYNSLRADHVVPPDTQNK